jgi:hypothetical protein
MRENEFTKILGWPGYRVYRHEIDEDKLAEELCPAHFMKSESSFNHIARKIHRMPML